MLFSRLDGTTALSGNYLPFDGSSCSSGSPANVGKPNAYLADLTDDDYKDIFICMGQGRPRLFTRTSASDWTSVIDSPLVSEEACRSALIADLNEVTILICASALLSIAWLS